MTTLTLVAGGAVRLPARTAVPDRSAGRRAPLHLTRRGRLALVLFAFVLLVGASLAATRASADGPTSAPQVERYVVSPGDTLWAIASGVARPGQDLREVIRGIEILNQMPSAALTEGQELLLPIGS